MKVIDETSMGDLAERTPHVIFASRLSRSALMLQRSLISCATLVLCGIVSLSASPLAQAGILTQATLDSSDGSLPSAQLSSTTAGEVLSASTSAPAGYYAPPSGAFVQTGSAGGSVYASTDYGVSRIGLSTALVYIKPPDNASAVIGYTFGSAYSHWSDTWSIQGGNVGDAVSGVISGHTAFDLSLSGPVQVGPGSSELIIEQFLNVGDAFGGSGVLFTTLDFVGATATGIDWQLAFTAHVGFDFSVESVFQVQTNTCGISDLNGTTCLYAFDSTHSSIFDSVVLDAGYLVSATSGDLIASGDGFTYRASLVSAVPEPSTLALMLGALPFVFVFARRAPQRLSIADQANGL